MYLWQLKRKRVVDMDEDGLPIVGSGVDLTKVSLTLQHQLLLTWSSDIDNSDYTFFLKVPAIQQRRIIAFLNQFIVHTVRFLNRFSTVCEEVCSPKLIIPLFTLTYILKVSMTWRFVFPETSNSIITNPTDGDHTKHFGSKGKSRQGFSD